MLADVRLAALRERPTSTPADGIAEGERRALARKRLERFGEERALTGIQARRTRARAAGKTACAADVGWNLLERGLLIACGARHDRDEQNQRYLKLLSASAIRRRNPPSPRRSQMLGVDRCCHYGTEALLERKWLADAVFPQEV